MRDKNRTYSRRDFSKKILKSAAGFAGISFFCKKSPSSPGNGNNGDDLIIEKSPVIAVKHDNSTISYYEVDPDIVQNMVDAGIKRLTEIDNVGEAWKSVFPGITRDKKISIKVNCIARQDHLRGLASHPEVAYSIVNGLKLMNVEGSAFPEENITIWDRSEFELERADYTINRGPAGVKCYGTRYEISQYGLIGGYDDSVVYDIAGTEQYLSKILTQSTDYLINLSVLKNHTITGVTMSLKNHYGSCWSPYWMHGGLGEDYITALNALSPIREKQVLCICDALFSIVSNGPMGPPQISTKTLLFSRDTVALDTACSKMLRDNGCNTTQIATYIHRASLPPYNLGRTAYELINIDNPTAG